MKLKYVLKDKTELEAISEDRREDYIEQEDGSYLLDVEGVKSFKDYKDTFDSLESLKKQHEEVKKSLELYGEVTPDKLAELKDQLKEAQAAASGTKDQNEIQKLAEEIYSIRSKDLTTKNKTLEEELQSANEKITMLNSSIQQNKLRTSIDRFVDGRVQPSAKQDIYLRANNANLSYMEDKDSFYDKASGKNLEEWLDKTIEENIHWQLKSQGGGARGGQGAGEDTEDDNPFKGW